MKKAKKSKGNKPPKELRQKVDKPKKPRQDPNNTRDEPPRRSKHSNDSNDKPKNTANTKNQNTNPNSKDLQNSTNTKNTNSNSQNRQHKQNSASNQNAGGLRGDFLRSSSALLASAVAAKASSLLGDDNDTTASGRPGEFDLYLFAQSWAPRFCCTSLEKCTAENMKGLSDLSTHGLWPAYIDANKDGRTYPAFCSRNSSSIPGVPGHMGSTRESHEWDKHGTCTGLSRRDYFQEEINIVKREGMDTAMSFTRETAGKTVNVEHVAAEFGGIDNIAFRSDKFCRLEEITTCWEKLGNGRVGRQIPCPGHVLASARNSAIMEHGCNKLWLDAPSECKFVSKQMLRDLKSKE